jgi:hypothetical protein
MATGRALEQSIAATQIGGEVVSFRARAERSTKPRQSMDERLQRAGFAVASELFTAYEGTDVTAGSQVHAPTVVAILATLAAEFAQAASAVNRRDSVRVTEAGWVLGGAADTILFAAEQASGTTTVWQVVADAAIARGLTASELPDMQAVVARAEAAIGDKPYPVLTVASSYRPKALLRAAAARHRLIAQAHAADEGLCSAHEQALVMGAAIGQIIRHEERPAPLTLLAAEAMIGGARLAPLPFAVG